MPVAAWRSLFTTQHGMERSRFTPTLSTHSSKYRLLQTLQSARQSVKYLRSSERLSEFSIFCNDTTFDNFSMLRMCSQLVGLNLKPVQRRMKLRGGKTDRILSQTCFVLITKLLCLLASRHVMTIAFHC